MTKPRNFLRHTYSIDPHHTNMEKKIHRTLPLFFITALHQDSETVYQIVPHHTNREKCSTMHQDAGIVLRVPQTTPLGRKSVSHTPHPTPLYCTAPHSNSPHLISLHLTGSHLTFYVHRLKIIIIIFFLLKSLITDTTLLEEGNLLSSFNERST